MLTPLDVETKTFKTSLGNYKKDDVDDFFKLVAADYKELYVERIALKDKISALSDAVAHYKSMEDVLQSSIVVAQTTGEEVKRIATDKANSIIQEAEVKANAIIVDAQQKVSRIDMEMSNMKIQLSSYRKQMEQILRNALDIVETMPAPGNILERSPGVKCSDETICFENPFTGDEDVKTYGSEPEKENISSQETANVPVIPED